MKTTVKTTTRVNAGSEANVHVQDKVATVCLLTMGGISGVIGLWSVVCLAAAFMGEGPISMIRGLFTALTGI